MSDTQAIKTPKQRLKFIDMARSVAILLMLEGHFVDDSLLMSVRDPENPIFATWVFIRSFTAPVFLTVTGLIFVYLLLKKRDENWFKNIRIRKGFKRVVELIFWGFLVQWYAFHVLECIAAGILSILLIYGLYKLIRIVPLWIYFFLAGSAVFIFYPVILENSPKSMFVYEYGWEWLMKSIYDPERDSVVWFSTFPFMGYTMFGAMIGTLLHDFHKSVKKIYFPGIFTAVGAILFFTATPLFEGLDALMISINPEWSFEIAELDWLYQRLGMVLMELSALMYIDIFWGHKIKDSSLFLKVGQNTLTIYVLHMVLLYGSITSIGLKYWFHKNLGPWEVTLGAILFIAFFVILIKYLDQIKNLLGFILNPIRNLFNRIFLIS